MKTTTLKIPTKFASKMKAVLEELHKEDKPIKPISRKTRFSPADLQKIKGRMQIVAKDLKALYHESERISDTYDNYDQMRPDDGRWLDSYTDKLDALTEYLHELTF